MRTRKRKSVVEEVENPEKSRLENIYKKDFVVVQFPDKMALTLDMKAVTTTKKWDVDDVVSYGEPLATGDQIVVRHSRKMDAKQQSCKAKVVIITAGKTEAGGLQKTLDEQAGKAMVQKTNSVFVGELNSNQRRILEKTRLSLKTGGFGKVELFPRSNVWVCGTRFKTFKSELHRNPLIDAVDLALLFFGPTHNALDLFVGRGFGLRAALGNGVVTDIVANFSNCGCV
ncbi:hypothetical protein RvY_03134 [Ramazzottius varieornatus]|uniref:Uncharacterized protein n=1 Tax=Ramazzottius varieornatus TaxID=947166 RepID=A0A1D1UQG9_RAMVA|nr:hypothetical protein RvY_03134 [Ramazzottius varieornatus]